MSFHLSTELYWTQQQNSPKCTKGWMATDTDEQKNKT